MRAEEPDRDLDAYLSASDDIIFFRVDDVANRRNDVSHGTPVDNILSRDLLRNYIAFIEAYAESLTIVAYERTLPFHIEHAVPLGKALGVIDHRIVCCALPDGEVSVGDTLIAKTANIRRLFKGGQIRELQRDNQPLESVTGGADVKVGIRVEFGVKDNHEFYLLKASMAYAHSSDLSIATDSDDEPNSEPLPS